MGGGPIRAVEIFSLVEEECMVVSAVVNRLRRWVGVVTISALLTSVLLYCVSMVQRGDSRVERGGVAEITFCPLYAADPWRCIGTY